MDDTAGFNMTMLSDSIMQGINEQQMLQSFGKDNNAVDNESLFNQIHNFVERSDRPNE